MTGSKRQSAILIIPDSIIADVLTKALKVADYGAVSVVTTVRALFEKLDGDDRKIDLIATALQLPDGDAYQLIDRLAQARYEGSLLFVADSPPALLEAAADLAVDNGLNVVGSFESPFSLRALLRALGEHAFGVPLGAHASGEHSGGDAVEMAMSKGDIEGVFQPKIDLRTDEVAGLEVLARWNHPRLGLLLPSQFIARAEKELAIHDLTEDIFRQGLAALKCCRQYAPRATVAVNLSGVSLGLSDLPDRLRRIAGEADVAPRHVIFEVTETQMLRDIRHAMASVNRLRLMGFGLALDDYGTGYSSLTRVKSLPFTELKVDRRFIHGAADRPSLVRILKNCVALGRDLGMVVVAEGVEREADREVVRSLGFDMVQGFYDCPPLRMKALEDWLDRRDGDELR